MAQNHYDFISIGSGPAGRRGALQAAKAGKKVAIVERRQSVGGVSLHVGTIPSKTLREAVLYLRGVRQHHFYGDKYTVKDNITLDDLNLRINRVLADELTATESQMRRNKIDLYYGQATFIDANRIAVENVSKSVTELSADYFLIATGSVPRRPPDIPFDYEVIFDSNFIFSSKNKRETLPRSMIVLGAGVIGSEYAAIFASLGIKVWLVDHHTEWFPFIDREILSVLRKDMEKIGVEFILGRKYRSVCRTEEDTACVELESGARYVADTLLFAMGRLPCTEPLRIDQLGVKCTASGMIQINSHYQTNIPNIYAAGDVVGFPALASTSAEQGRIAARHAFNIPGYANPELFPYAIYTIPEVSIVGKTEEQLIQEGVPYGKGLALYREIAKASMIGDETGALKLLFHRETHKLLGVHIIGDQGSELIHIGQAVMGLGGTIEFLADNVFNYPTLSASYKIAALAGLNSLVGKANILTLDGFSVQK